MDSQQFFTPLLLTVSSQHDHSEAVESFLAKLKVQTLLPWASHIQTQFIFWLNKSHESISIETVRQLQSNLGYSPDQERIACFVLLHAEKITLPAQQALLKILEEPPQHTVLILVTQSETQLLPTIQSRCTVLAYNIDHITNTKKKPDQNAANLQKVLGVTSFSDVIAVVQEYKERADALIFVEELMNQIHSQLKVDHSPRLFSQLRMCDEAYKAIHGNANVTLALEYCFFQFIRA